MILEQFYLACLSQASYLVADEASGRAVVVDPRRDVDEYLQYAEEHGLRIVGVALTHFHADFLAGHLELQAKTGATLYLGSKAKAEYEFTPLYEGDAIELGNVRIEALETPGHTPESVTYLIYDLAKNPGTPHAILTGDTLFIGDVGRPDLMASVGISANELAGMLYESLHGKLSALPDETIVYPGHGAGSACGKALSSETWSTLGEQRANNYALQPMDKHAFVDLVTAGQPTAPAYFSYDATLNKKRRTLLDESLARALVPLAVDRVLAMRDASLAAAATATDCDASTAATGAAPVVLDVRSPEDFARAHLSGSVNIGLGGRYASWAGTMLSPESPIALITDPGSETEAAMRLGRIGFDNIAGYLEGGFAALQAQAADELTSFERLDPPELAQRLASANAATVLDVRGPGEREESAIEPSQHIPLPELEARLAELDRDREFVVVCAGGYRSMIAASLLEKHGFDRLLDLRGGQNAWNRATTS